MIYQILEIDLVHWDSDGWYDQYGHEISGEIIWYALLAWHDFGFGVDVS